MKLKNLKKQKLALLSLCLFLHQPALASDVIIGLPSWTSAQVTGHVLKVILEDNLGLEVETQPGTNPVIFEAMGGGSMHVHPEVWLPNQQNLHDEYVKEKDVVAMNSNVVESVQAMCVTKSTSEKHDITSIYDLTDPNKAALFDTDGDGLGEAWLGPVGWASTEIGKVRAKSYGYAETFELLQLDEAVNIAALAEAVRQDKPYVFYCYTPHTMFSTYDLVILEEPPYNEAEWNFISEKDDPDWLEKSNIEMAYPLTELNIHYAKALEKSHPAAAALLANVNLDADTVAALMLEVDINKRDLAEVAKEWVANNSDRVESWLGN